DHDHHHDDHHHDHDDDDDHHHDHDDDHHHHHHDHHHHDHDDHHHDGTSGVRQLRDLQHRHRPAEAVLLGSGLQPRIRGRRRRQDQHQRVGRDQDHHDSRPLHGGSGHHPRAVQRRDHRRSAVGHDSQRLFRRQGTCAGY